MVSACAVPIKDVMDIITEDDELTHNRSILLVLQLESYEHNSLTCTDEVFQVMEEMLNIGQHCT